MNKHLIEVRYIPASDSKPARISLTSHWNGERVIKPIPKGIIFDWYHFATLQFNDEQEWTILSEGKMKRGYFIIVNEFKSLKST